MVTYPCWDGRVRRHIQYDGGSNGDIFSMTGWRKSDISSMLGWERNDDIQFAGSTVRE